jgi:capsular polysaccharide biosynthesis protein
VPGASPGLFLHEDVIAWPLSPGRTTDFSGGLLDRDSGELLPEAVHANGDERYQEQPDISAADLRNLPELAHPVLYGGILYPSFGHCMLESLGRLWAYNAVRAVDPYIFFYAPVGIPDYLERRNFLHQVLAGFRIPHERVLTAPTPIVLRQVAVPRQRYGYDSCLSPSEQWLDFVRGFQFDRRAPRGFASADKVYVSRSGMPGSSGKPMGEGLFENYLRSEGYAIFYPERHRLDEQLTVYERARQLIFSDGAALHACVLLPDLSADVAVVARRRDTRWDCSEIVHGFVGYGQRVEWIDAVRAQYQLGLESWNARTLVDWHAVSSRLVELGFAQRPVEPIGDVAALVEDELSDYVRSVSTNPSFLSFVRRLDERDVLDL